MFDGNGTEVFAVYGGHSMTNNFQHVSFGESKNITIQVSLIDSWSSVKINYGTMKQRLDSGKEKRKALFLYKRWLEWMKPHSWFSCWSLSSMQAKLHCRWSEIKMLLMGIYKSFLISLIQNIKKAGSGLVVVTVFHAIRVFCDTFLVSYVATYT